MHSFLCVCVFAYIHIYIHTQMYFRASLVVIFSVCIHHARIFSCVRVFIYHIMRANLMLCAYMCIYICACACVCVYVCVHIHMRARSHVRSSKPCRLVLRAYLHFMCAHFYVCMKISECVYTRTCSSQPCSIASYWLFEYTHA